MEFTDVHPPHKAIGNNNYTLLVGDLVPLTPKGDSQQSVAKSGKILQAYEMTISSSKTETMKMEGCYMRTSKFGSE
jgi:hypothetical protein